MNDNFLTIEEKRAWLARIFRDPTGEYTDSDKLKALEADNRLVMLQSPNCQVNLDGSFHEITKSNPQNGIKNTEMTDKSTENAKSNSPTCGNCVFYSPYTHRPDHGKCIKYAGMDWTYSNHEATYCRGYEPEQD